MREQNVQNAILIALQEAYPNGLWCRRNVGAVKTDKGFVRFGMAGMADISGIVRGEAIELEVKSVTGRLSEAQINWGKAVERAGGIYIVARSVDEALRLVASRIAR
jgi:hypothetical protein